MDRTTTIRASVRGHRDHADDLDHAGRHGGFRFPAQRLGHRHPSIAVPLSLLGTFGVMYLLGYSLDNLSLMALTISTGFVVDDAIVVIENIAPLSRKGHAPRCRRPFEGAERSALLCSR